MENTSDGASNTTSSTSGDHKSLHFGDLLKVGQEAASDVKHKLGDAKDFTVDRASSMYGSLVSTIKARPLLSVGIAFGVGYFAMRMFRSDRSKSVSAA